VIDFDTALSEQFLDVAIGQAKRRYQRTVTTITGREAEASEGGPQDQGSTRAAPGRRVLMPAVWVLERGHSECNSARTALLRRIGVKGTARGMR
jgi:hypothetical protein